MHRSKFDFWLRVLDLIFRLLSGRNGRRESSYHQSLYRFPFRDTPQVLSEELRKRGGTKHYSNLTVKLGVAEAEIRSLAARKTQLAVRLAHVERERDKALQVRQSSTWTCEDYCMFPPRFLCIFGDVCRGSPAHKEDYTLIKKSSSHSGCPKMLESETELNICGVLPLTHNFRGRSRPTNAPPLPPPLSLIIAQRVRLTVSIGAGNRRSNFAQKMRDSLCHNHWEEQAAATTSLANLISGAPPAPSARSSRHPLHAKLPKEWSGIGGMRTE